MLFGVCPAYRDILRTTLADRPRPPGLPVLVARSNGRAVRRPHAAADPHRSASISSNRACGSSSPSPNSSRAVWVDDFERQRAARRRGDEFRPYTHKDVFEQPHEMLADLASLLGIPAKLQ